MITDTAIEEATDNLQYAETVFRMISPGFRDDCATPRESGVAQSVAQSIRRLGCLRGSSSRIRQREHKQGATQCCVLGEVLVPTDRTEACGGLGQAGCHADARPSADARVHADELLAVVLIREHVADDSRGRLELPQLLAVLQADRLQVAFQRAVERNVAGS